jgi:ArsR family transcriptional regulator, arsenate/arsenite/antimonite-responsive transcriptional repressor
MDDITELTDTLKALSDPTRFRIVELLSRKDCFLCVNALSNILEVSASAVSQHLKILKQAGIVHGERKGYHVHYSVQKEKVKQLCTLLQDRLK